MSTFLAEWERVEDSISMIHQRIDILAGATNIVECHVRHD